MDAEAWNAGIHLIEGRLFLQRVLEIPDLFPNPK